MGKERMTAFSDGVIAIIITILVLELKVPHETDWSGLVARWPIFLAYVLSFVNIGLIWNNHHHMMMPVERVDGRVLWANLFVMFWLSLLPFVTAWMGESHYAPLPTALYGIVILCLAFAWYALAKALIACNGGAASILAEALGKHVKTISSGVLTIIAIPSALLGYSWISVSCYLAIAAIWIIPDRRIEQRVSS
jgi:uncharacterized membrane protein